MNTRIVAGLLAALASLASSSGANAAILHFGCQGQLGERQMIFNRYSMVIVDTKQKMGDIHGLSRDKIELPPGSPPSISYDASNENDLDKIMKFVRSDDIKRELTLTETSSRRVSHKHRRVCGRDEDTDIYRKVYHFQIEGEPARDITMQCIWYQLSTHGGRKGCD